MTPAPYQRLKASRRGLLMRGTLWLGSDHILSVSSSRFRDQYLRYYFSDIQAFTVRQTSQLGPWPLVASIVAILLPLALFGFWAPWAAAIFSVPILIFVVINFAFGPRCEVTIITRIGQDRLPALSRLRQSRQVLDYLRQVIEAKQGAIDIHTLANTVAGQVGSVTAQQIAQNRTPRNPSSRQVASPRWLPIATYAGFIVFAALLLWQTIAASPLIDLASIFLGSLLLGGLVWILVVQLLRSRAVSSWLLSALGLLTLTVLPIYRYVVTLIAIAQLKTPPRDAQMYSLWRQHSSFPMSLYVFAAIAIAIGMLGLLLSLLYPARSTGEAT